MPQGPEKPRKIILSWGFTPVLTAVVLVITALTGAYVGGVMSGRHLFMPQQEAPESAPVREDPPKEGILKPGELDFAHVLRGQPPPKTHAPPQAEPAPAAEDKPAEPPLEDKAAQVGDQTDASTEDAAAPPTPGLVEDYVFQLAALKDPRSVDALREKLEGLGLRTRMERNGKLYLVLVHMRGSRERVDEIIAIARDLRLGEPLLLSKKPVTP